MSRFWEIFFCEALLFHRHVCLLIKNTRRHASYRWPPAKLCSATLRHCFSSANFVIEQWHWAVGLVQSFNLLTKFRGDVKESTLLPIKSKDLQPGGSSQWEGKCYWGPRGSLNSFTLMHLPSLQFISKIKTNWRKFHKLFVYLKKTRIMCI